MVIPMSDLTETPAPEGPISFVRWVHAQAKGDKERQMPYAAIYRWGPSIQDFLGIDGKFSAEWVAVELSQRGADAEDLAALASAEAAWRVDSIIDHAEQNGVVLDPGYEVPGSTDTGGEVVSPSVSQALQAADAKVMCGFRNHRGEGCTEEAVPGAGRCGKHGGSITDPEVRRSFLLVSFAKIIDGSRIAVDALLDVAENGRSEMARVQAAKEILDRAGVQQDQHVHIHKPDEDASEDELLAALRDRLLETKSRLRLTAVESNFRVVHDDGTETPALLVNNPPRTHGDDDIIDAEVVEENGVART